MEQEQIEVVEEDCEPTTTVESMMSTAETLVVTGSGDPGPSSSTSPRLLQPLHPLRKVGRWHAHPQYSATQYVEAVGAPAPDRDHHYIDQLEHQDDNHHPPQIAENIVVTSDDMMGEIISVTDVVEEEVKTSHSPHHHLASHHLEPNLPPGSLVKVEVVMEDHHASEDSKAAAFLAKGMVTADGMDPQWPEHPDPSPPPPNSHYSMPSTSTILIPAGHDVLRHVHSAAPTTTTFIYARPNNSHLSSSERMEETVNDVVSSVMGRRVEYETVRASSGLPSFPSLLPGSGGIEVVEEVLQPPPPLPSLASRPQSGPVTIVKTRRPRSSLTDEDRRFRCTYCDKAFTARSSLDVHERIHTGERPYKCTECGKTFRHCGHLTCHLRTHTGERPYVCRVCGKGFTQSTPCRRHEQTQHNLSP